MSKSASKTNYKGRRRAFWLKVLAVLVFIIPVSLAGHYIEEQLSVLSPEHLFLRDFDYTDVYYRLHLPGNGKDEAGEIVIISDSGMTINNVIELVDTLYTMEPKVIGLDYLLDEQKESADGKPVRQPITDMLSRGSNIVIAFDRRELEHVASNDAVVPGTTLPLGKGSYGFANLSDSVSTIRSVPLKGRIGEKDMNAFGLAIAIEYLGAGSSTISQYFDGAEHDLRIKYLPTDAYTTIQGIKVMKEPARYHDELEGKIVLIGSTDGRDRHFTPLNPVLGGRPFPDMDGVYIHAGIVHSLLSPDKIKDAATWQVYLIMLIVVLLLTPLFLFFFERCDHIFHFPLVLLYEIIVNVVLLIIVVFSFHYSVYITQDTPHLILHILPFTIWLVNAVSYKFFEKVKHKHSHE